MGLALTTSVQDILAAPVVVIAPPSAPPPTAPPSAPTTTTGLSAAITGSGGCDGGCVFGMMLLGSLLTLGGLGLGLYYRRKQRAKTPRFIPSGAASSTSFGAYARDCNAISPLSTGPISISPAPLYNASASPAPPSGATKNTGALSRAKAAASAGRGSLLADSSMGDNL